MDGSSFDRLARLAAFGASRRNLIKAALVPAAAVVAAPVLGVEEAGAKKRNNKRCLKSGKLCGQFANGKNKKCCTKQKLLCRVPRNAGNSDTRCCGGQGATCGGDIADGDDQAPLCCIGFICSTDTGDSGVATGPGKCQPFIEL